MDEINSLDDGVEQYNSFLDGVRSLDDLQRGLAALGPLTADAWAVAAAMDESDFIDFKLMLAHERFVHAHGGDSNFNERYLPILIPERFFAAIPLAEKFGAPVGTALMRTLAIENI